MLASSGHSTGLPCDHGGRVVQHGRHANTVPLVEFLDVHGRLIHTIEFIGL